MGFYLGGGETGKHASNLIRVSSFERDLNIFAATPCQSDNNGFPRKLAVCACLRGYTCVSVRSVCEGGRDREKWCSMPILLQANLLNICQICHFIFTWSAFVCILNACKCLGMFTEWSLAVHQLTMDTLSLALAISAAFSSICKKVTVWVNAHTDMEH